MKKILITGANSYVGTSFENWLKQWPEDYLVETVDMKQDSWRLKDFSEYDVVFHVAGIAHVKETRKNRDLYYKVNRDLAYETAKKAKAEGVKQFILLSSMSVYGMNTGIIYKNSIPKPSNNYGKSKFQADLKINELDDKNFTVATLRPPMIYGKGCKGNYILLSKYACKLLVFPDIDNIRSMLFIDNLSEFVRELIDSGRGGLYFPQNAEYVKTSHMVKKIAEVHGKKIILTKLFNKFIALINLGIFKKVFGNLVYEKVDICDYVTFKDSIVKSEL